MTKHERKKQAEEYMRARRERAGEKVMELEEMVNPLWAEAVRRDERERLANLLEALTKAPALPWFTTLDSTTLHFAADLVRLGRDPRR